ncbi:MAG: polyhydroxybutyrate depolymerase [Chloroflexi bacterium]|nr:polyhydroxybutyrate depolymerase [Chloroflexota bacterium]
MTKSHQLFAVLCVVLLSALACARSAVNPATPSPSSLPAGEVTRTLTHDRHERSYILYVPASIDWSQPVPLVFVFHGGMGNAASAIHMSGFNQVADQNGFLVAYPNGTSRLSDDKLLTWNSGNCCGYAQQKNMDDIGFVRAIVTDLQSLVDIDVKRIYASGMSNGGMLSHRLACEAADVFAAVAPVAGTLNFSPCNPSQPISVIEFHGTGDQHLPYDGGFGSESLVDVDFTSVQDSIRFWTSFDGCASQPQTNSFDNIKREVWTGCAASTSVELYTIIGEGHTWPGGAAGRESADRPTQTISASQLIWEFFAAHPKP